MRELGKPAEVALVIGHHPAVLMGAVSKLEGIGGELEVAGGLMGESLEMVKAKTVDLEVPARAEIVIEGIIDTDPEAVQNEGPFGEYPRYYTRVGPQPYVKITAITMRAQADLPGRLQRPHASTRPRRAAAHGRHLPARQGGDAVCHGRQPAADRACRDRTSTSR